MSQSGPPTRTAFCVGACGSLRLLVSPAKSRLANLKIKGLDAGLKASSTRNAPQSEFLSKL